MKQNKFSFLKKPEIDIKLFLLLTIFTLVFTTSLIFTFKSIMIEAEVRELRNVAKTIYNNNILNTTPYLAPHLIIVETNHKINDNFYYEIQTTKNQDFLVFYFKNLVIKKDITFKNRVMDIVIILVALFILGFLILIYIYSVSFAYKTKKPILQLNRYIENINEKSLHQIPTKQLPEDFHLLAETINRLINRIDNFISTQKELFIGASHELKTPLTVIKLKNQVLLLKERSIEDYIEQLHFVNKKIDEMDKIITDVLNIGRQESAQFEEPIRDDIIKIIKELAEEFQILAGAQNKNLIINLSPNQYISVIQKTLLKQIIQNFLQNAIKFTPQNKNIEIKSSVVLKSRLKIEVIDEGIGIDEKQDIFAPFSRTGNKSGVGLGLFLAKSGADAIGAKISVKNRRDGNEGAVATLILQNNISYKFLDPGLIAFEPFLQREH